MQTPRDERAAARVRAIETLEARFLAHTRIDPDTARGLVAWALFDEAKGHHGGEVRTVRGFARRELDEAVRKRARDRNVAPPADTRSLNTIVGRLGEALASFGATAPHLPLITAVAGPTSIARGDKLRRTFFHIAFTDEPPTLPSRPPRRVPAAPAVLVGRDHERADLRALLASEPPPPLIVLHGIPGIGRTALARTVVHELLDADAFTSAISYAFEGAPPSVGEVLTALVDPSGGPFPDAALRSQYLALLDAIVLLDDLPDGWPIEQLQPPRGSVVLLTAQHAVRLPEVVNRLLEPLAEEDAIRFLMALDPRLQQENPAYEAQWFRWTLLGRREPRPHPTAASELAELCAYVPGELRAAATALREQPGMDVRMFLGSYRESLAGGPEVVSSATTARANAYAMPYARLPDEERRVFLALAAFGGTFSLDEARVVADDPEGASLVQLTRAGFVTYDVSAARYTVPMPLRLFGRRWLASDRERARVLARFATHFAERGMLQAERGALVLGSAPTDVLANFVAAQHAAEELGDVSLIARYGELAACANPPADIAEPWLDAGATAARTCGDPAQVLRIAVARIGQYRTFALERALDTAEEALAAVTASACEGDSSEVLGGRRVAVAQIAIRVAKALGRARTVLALAAEVLGTNGFANAADHDTLPVLIAEAHADLGQTDDALRWARRAVRDARDLPHRIYRANAFNVHGAALLAAGRRTDARRAFDAALALYPDAFDTAAGETYLAPPVDDGGPPNLGLALRDSYADQAKLHPALVAYALRTWFVHDPGEAARRMHVMAAGIASVGQFMPAFYVAFGTLLLDLARRTHDRAHAGQAFFWLTCAIGLFAARGMDDLLRSEGVDIAIAPESTETSASASLLMALTSTPFTYLQDVRAVGNAYYHRAEALVLLEKPGPAADDFEAAADILSTIESPLLPRIARRVRALQRARR